MKTLKKNLFLQITLVCLILLSLTACGKPSAASLGIERLSQSIPIRYEKLGLGVYGQFTYDFDKKSGQIQIDAADLPKIKEGYSLSFLSSSGSFGTVKSLPDSKTPDISGKCTIEIEVKNDDSPLLLSTKTVAINLPPEDNHWCLDNKCIQEGKDGKKYVWTTEKKDLVQQEDWQLKEVKTGKTDGRRTEILGSLKADTTVLMPFNINNIE